MLKRFRMSRLGHPESRALPVHGFRDGSEEAFSAIYDWFRPPIRSYIASRIADPADQEEITQEIFLKAYRFRSSYNPRFELSTWLWTVARNTVSDWLRKHRPAMGARAPEAGPEFSVEDFPCGRHDAETRMIHRSQRRNLIRLFRHLTRPQRRVLWLRIIHQHSYQEIGRQLGLSLPSVKNLSLRARVKLAEVTGSRPCFA